MPSKATKPSKAIKGSGLITSMSEIPMAAPRRPANQGGQLVGGMPVDFGIKKSGKRGGRPTRTSRKKMY